MSRIQISLAVAAILAGECFAQQPAPVIKGGAEEVVLDIVVRDKKGKQLADFGPEDFEITDNGVKQSIRGFRLVEGREAVAKGGGKVALDPLRQVRLVTLLFQGMSPESRQFARRAALDLFKNEIPQNVFFSVMTLDNQLNVIQQFTGDKDRLRRAVEKATGGTYAEYATETLRVEGELKNMMASADRAAPDPEKAPSAYADYRMAQAVYQMFQSTQTMSSNDWWRTAVTSLLRVVNGQSSLPGRKTVVYFSEGLRVPTYLDQLFETTMSSANRANVSFYCIDSRGVGGSGAGDARGALAGAAASIKSDVESSSGAVRADQVLAADNAEEGMRGDLQAKLRQLSESTGGFLIADTNDLKSPLRKINEEINSYYEVTYNPMIDNYDGRFRKIGVRVLRGDAKVSARNGYFALPVLSGTEGTLLPYEVPLLKALGTSPLPKELEFRTAVMRFQQNKEGIKGALVIEVPFKSLTFTENAAKKTFAMHLSLVALIKDSKGGVVKKFDRDLPLEYPLDRMNDAKAANFQYNESFALPAGRYTIESAVMDRDGGKIGARRATLIAAVRNAGVGISSLSVVRRYEPKAKNLDPDEQFEFQGGKVTPSLAATVPAAKGSMLSVYFVIFPDAAIAEKPQAMVEFLLDGKAVGGGAVPLPAADERGRIAYVLTTPAENMKPGQYEVHAVVKQGATAAEERTFVTIEAPGQ